MRTFDNEVAELIKSEIHLICEQVGAGMGVKVAFEGDRIPYPATINDAAETEFAGGVLDALVGPDNVDRDRDPVMGGEDFAFMAQARPGCFIFVGNGDSAPLHTPRYNFNDDAAPFGVAYWAKLVETALPVS